MTIVERVGSTTTTDGFTYDTITLAWEDRRQGHGRRRSDGGLDFAISLPGGTVLKEADLLVLPDERVVISVREAIEEVYVIQPQTPQEWAYYAYHVGNRHQPVMITSTELVFPRNPAVKSLLEQLRVPYESQTRAFTATVAQPLGSHVH